ncbi:hypothetical protein NX779_00360 [Mycoplasma cottewii]|uniref:Lipoprotein associated domain n=1 Tax=Mycoplasma cottewii TaxID=51364 RepID=A0ABY5TXK7_9MOLU|nr:hypothetical protein [Mycoplasma cottewii]UWD35099.1 hypothetical protein NX779_00360 [Mycoplasma cottewii]
MKLKDLITKKVMIIGSSVFVTISAATTTGVLVSKINSKTDISKIELETNIGSIKEKNNNLIIQKFIDINKEKIAELNKDDFDLKEENRNSIVIEVKKDNQKYKGEITISFRLKTDIATLDLNPNVGAFNQKNDNLIIQRFIEINKDKLASLTKNDFEVVSNENRILILKVKDDNNDWFGNILINFSIKTDIATLDLNPNVGAFNSDDASVIVQKFIDINKDKLTGFNKNDFEVLSNEDGILILKVKDDNNDWFGNVLINYSIKINIENIRLVKNFAVDNDQDQEIITTFLRINNRTLQNGLTKDDLEIEKTPGRVGDSAKAILKVKKDNQKYQGQITITYRIRKDINTIEGLKTELFCLDSNADEPVIKASIVNLFFELNKQKIYPLAFWNLNVVNLNINERKATITIINSEDYKGQIEVTLKDKLDISKIDGIKNTIFQYSESTANFEISDFITANKDKLPLLIASDLEISKKERDKNKLVIKVDNSRFYKGEITINWKRLTDISENKDIKLSIDLKDEKPLENNIIELFYETNKDTFEKLKIKKEDVKVESIRYSNEEADIRILGSEKYWARFKVKYKFNRIDINTLKIKTLNVRGKKEINEQVIKEAFAKQYSNLFFFYRWEFLGYAETFSQSLEDKHVEVIEIKNDSVEVKISYENWFKNSLKLRLIK